MVTAYILHETVRYIASAPCLERLIQQKHVKTIQLRNKLYSDCILHRSTMFIASATCLQRLTELWEAVETVRLYAAERVHTINPTDA